MLLTVIPVLHLLRDNGRTLLQALGHGLRLLQNCLRMFQQCVNQLKKCNVLDLIANLFLGFFQQPLNWIYLFLYTKYVMLTTIIKCFKNMYNRLKINNEIVKTLFGVNYFVTLLREAAWNFAYFANSLHVHFLCCNINDDSVVFDPPKYCQQHLQITVLVNSIFKVAVRKNVQVFYVHIPSLKYVRDISPENILYLTHLELPAVRMTGRLRHVKTVDNYSLPANFITRYSCNSLNIRVFTNVSTSENILSFKNTSDLNFSKKKILFLPDRHKTPKSLLIFPLDLYLTNKSKPALQFHFQIQFYSCLSIHLTKSLPHLLTKSNSVLLELHPLVFIQDMSDLL